jgi:uncharacterized protein (DUF736 family)
MANIGTFTKTEQGFTGELVTLSLKAKGDRRRDQSLQRQGSEPPRLRGPSRLCGVRCYAECRRGS